MTRTDGGTAVVDRESTTGEDRVSYRQRLLPGLAASIAVDGYPRTAVADIVRHARTSRRTFYEHFADKEACFVALLADVCTQMIGEIAAAVDPSGTVESPGTAR